MHLAIATVWFNTECNLDTYDTDKEYTSKYSEIKEKMLIKTEYIIPKPKSLLPS